MHMRAEGLQDWLEFMRTLLNKNGRIWLLLSPDAWMKTAQKIKLNNLRIAEVFKLFRMPSTLWRVVVCLSDDFTFEKEEVISEIFVVEEDGKPSAFTLELLDQYYLKRNLL